MFIPPYIPSPMYSCTGCFDLGYDVNCYPADQLVWYDETKDHPGGWFCDQCSDQEDFGEPITALNRVLETNDDVTLLKEDA